MIKLGICSNDNIVIISLAKYISYFFRKYSFQVEVDTFTGFSCFETSYKSKKHDLLFIDMDIPEKTGFQVAEEVRLKRYETVIIFISETEQFIFQSLKYKPFCFMKKSVLEEQTPKVLDAFLQIYLMSMKEKIFEFSDGSQAVRIRDIEYIESFGHILSIHIWNNNIRNTKRHSISLKKLEEELELYGFIRIHKSYLLNYRYIYLIKENDIVLKSGEILPMGRERAGRVKTRYFELITNEAL